MNTYQVGSLVTVSNTDYSSVGFLETATNSLADPAVVTLFVSIGEQAPVVSTWTSGGGSVGPYTIVQTGLGQFQAELDTTGQLAEWIYTWAGSGGGPQAIKSNTFSVTDYPK